MEVKQDSKRLRMIAGPNGSGKSTIINQLSSQFNTGVYLNADDLEKEFNEKGYINLDIYNLKDTDSFKSFVENHTLTVKALKSDSNVNLELSSNIIKNIGKMNSYKASIIVDFIRTQLIESSQKLTFETVMSHHSKIDFLNFANKLGYKSYLYFVGTDSVDINVKRVEERSKKGGHFVSPDKIRSRYLLSMGLLKDAIKSTYRTFIFDNSEKAPVLILEIFKGEEITFHHNEIPLWIDKYLFQK